MSRYLEVAVGCKEARVQALSPASLLCRHRKNKTAVQLAEQIIISNRFGQGKVASSMRAGKQDC